MSDWNAIPSGFAAIASAVGQVAGGHHDTTEPFDAVEAYFECITTCSLDDAECITVCTTKLRDHN